MVTEDVPGPGRARAGHVIVRPEAVGICGSDFHLFSGDVGALSGARDFYPRVQGHEVSAIVEDPGDSAHPAGERVAIWPLLPCGHCYPCRSERPNVCPNFRLVGVHLDGGLQERLEVPASTVFGDFSAAIRLVAVGRAASRTAMAALFSHHFPLTRAAEAFEFALSRPPDAIKIVVTVN